MRAATKKSKQSQAVLGRQRSERHVVSSPTHSFIAVVAPHSWLASSATDCAGAGEVATNSGVPHSRQEVASSPFSRPQYAHFFIGLSSRPPQDCRGVERCTVRSDRIGR